jgi:hypothetical protein
MNVGSALDVYTTSICQEINVLYVGLQDLEDKAFIDTSTGVYLDQLALEAGFNRNSGIKALGYVTFIRNSPATSDFSIPEGSQISTIPIQSEEQLIFETITDKTFKTEIENETNIFLDGIFFYKPNQRSYEDLDNISGEVSGVATNFEVDEDFQLTDVEDKKIVDVSTVVTLDDCDATTDWTITGEATAISINSSVKKQVV